MTKKPTLTRDHDDIRITLPGAWIETMLRRRGIEIVDDDAFTLDLIDALRATNVLANLVQSEAEFALEDGRESARHVKPKTGKRLPADNPLVLAAAPVPSPYRH